MFGTYFPGMLTLTPMIDRHFGSGRARGVVIGAASAGVTWDGQIIRESGNRRQETAKPQPSAVAVPCLLFPDS
jgi:hypothetical protein